MDCFVIDQNGICILCSRGPHGMKCKFLEPGRINSVRGLACILLVLFHSAAGASAVLHQEDAVLKWLMASLSAVRMPLFSMLSGIVYALRPVEKGAATVFIVNKVRRLLIPYILVMILLLSLESLAGNSGKYRLSDIPYYIVFPWEHLWFLQAIFIVFIFFTIFDTSFPKRRREVAVASLALSSLSFIFISKGIVLFAINGAFYLFPFFACGVVFCRYSDEVNKRYEALVVSLMIITTTLFLLHAGFIGPKLVGRAGRYTLETLSLGLAACVLIILIFPSINWMAAIGRRSFTIYLFHTAFASAANRVVHEFYSLVAFSLVIGIVGPMAADWLIKNRLPIFKAVIGEKRGLRPRRPVI
jgi:peptidoglycan/LPS O-acetylase OafA/YrhL